MNKEQLFFELIQVAIGNKVCLSHTPLANEWGELYAMAKKQSLVGVCFAGVQRLQQQRQEPPEMLYLTWMGMAAKIQQRNEVVNRQCAELQAKLSGDGFRSCVLKGQGVAAEYGSLSLLRQSGDIDIWVIEEREKIIDYVQKVCGQVDLHTTLVHIDMPIFSDTDVEIHFTPSILRNPIKNRLFQNWVTTEVEMAKEREITLVNGKKLRVPNTSFNIVFLLAHAFKHLINEGIGLRQLLDIYFVLKNAHLKENEKLHIMQNLQSFGMGKFTEGVMWVMKHAFALEDYKFICQTNAKHGEYLLSELMACGNFGHNDDRLENSNREGRSKLQLKRNLIQAQFYPDEIIGSFWWRIKSLFSK